MYLGSIWDECKYKVQKYSIQDIKKLLLSRVREILVDNNRQRETPIGKEELRCVKRSDLVEILAENLPPETIRFGCQIVAVKLDPLSSDPVLQLYDGTFIKAKVVIGSDGANSVVAEFLGLKATKLFSYCAIRGFTNHPTGHGLNNEFIRTNREGILQGRIPVDDKLVCWFIGRQWTPEDSRISKDPKLVKESAVQSIKAFPSEMVELVKNSDIDSVSLVRLRYRTPWDVLLGSFRKGRVTVAGDAMHVMGPFLGQGGSAGLEDAIVLARCLVKEISSVVGVEGCQQRRKLMPETSVLEAALDRYIRERKMRIVRLSTQTYLTGLLLRTSVPLIRFSLLILLFVLFGNSLGHTRYDCGRL
ncbi:PREDICTED: uncharacterized protein LOC104594023 [Nelumbo nucifera]|uniref:Uncharacterized protein LOC104594023 n=1 Tax=Nelumbo nucifera TaxID=4432 RepID=A0A1U7ZL51_NELNU|nr:PREDICTED: uncharacterized protein LOC104594023 [Nelumbo nucifera]